MRRVVARLIGPLPGPRRSRTLCLGLRSRSPAIMHKANRRPTPARPRHRGNRPRQATIAVTTRYILGNAGPVMDPAARRAIVLDVHGTCRSATPNHCSSFAKSAHIAAIRAAVAAVPPRSAVAAIAACRSARRRNAATAPSTIAASTRSTIAKP
jgi:hypothetical protein